MILLPDPGASQLVWQLQYSALTQSDVQALTTLFQACAGPVHAFTFIDPADNMLAGSSALAAPAWNIPGTVTVSPGGSDPTGGSDAFVLTNMGQAPQSVTQTLNVPASYQYSFAVYAMSGEPAVLTLTTQGTTAQAANSYPIGTAWSRLVFSGALNDLSTTFTVGIQLSAGQQVTVYGPQLEPQRMPSRYRATNTTGGVYPHAHWGTDELLVTAQAPGLFTTAFIIETAI